MQWYKNQMSQKNINVYNPPFCFHFGFDSLPLLLISAMDFNFGAFLCAC